MIEDVFKVSKGIVLVSCWAIFGENKVMGHSTVRSNG